MLKILLKTIIIIIIISIISMTLHEKSGLQNG